MRKVILVLLFCFYLPWRCYANSYDLAEIDQCKLVTSYTRDTLIDQIDTVKFGSYYQSNSSIKEPIEWIVLDRNGNNALLLSKYIIDFMCYNDTTDIKDTTWEKSTLRKWLNNTFLRNAFNENEQTCIIVSYILNNSNPDWGTDGGNNTSDKIFCLSVDEVIKYFDNPEAFGATAKGSKFSATRPTNYAINKNIGIYKNLVNNGTAWHKGNGAYWLRTPGLRKNHAIKVNYGGTFSFSGSFVNKWVDDDKSNIYPGVRPALWVDITAFSKNDSIMPVTPVNPINVMPVKPFEFTDTMPVIRFTDPIVDDDKDLEDSLKEKLPDADAWYKTKGGAWYYYEGDRTTKKKGWFVDPTDGQTYYLKPSTGKMAVGWTKIEGSKYYFNEFHDNSGNWYETGGGWYESRGKKVKAYGSMFRNEVTPDGKWVDIEGRLIE